MQFIFSILSLVAIVGFVVWWGLNGTPVDAPTQVTPTTEVTPTETQNPITAPIKQAEEVKQLIESSNLISLDLSEKGLKKVPDYVFARTDLEFLDLSNNELTGALQAEVRHLQSLKKLDLSGNKFTGVPAEVGQLKNLEILDLSNNVLTGLPYELGNLSNLKILDLSGNHYSEADLTIIQKSLPVSVEIKTN